MVIIVIAALIVVCYVWWNVVAKQLPQGEPIPLSFKTGDRKITLITALVVLQMLLTIVDAILLLLM